MNGRPPSIWGDSPPTARMTRLPTRALHADPDPTWVELLGIPERPDPAPDLTVARDVLGALAVFLGFLLVVAFTTAVVVIVAGAW